MLVGVNMIIPGASGVYGEAGLPDYAKRYLLQAVRAASRLQDATRFIVFHAPGAQPAGIEAEMVEISGTGRGFFSRSGPLDGVWQAAKRARVDLMLSPIQAALTGVDLPHVFLALDLHPWENELGAPAKTAVATAVKKTCARAKALVAPSEYVRRRCWELFDVPLNKTVVAPPGIPVAFKDPQNPMVALPYLMVYDDGHPAESVRMTAEALKKNAHKLPENLVVAGPAAAEPELWGENVVRVEYCPDAQLASLYQHCSAFICPGRSDGGMLRVLEALGAGACAVAPHSQVATEIVADAPFYYNPESRASFMQALTRVLELTPEEKAQRMRHDKAVAARFSWDQTAWKLLSAFKKTA